MFGPSDELGRPGSPAGRSPPGRDSTRAESPVPDDTDRGPSPVTEWLPRELASELLALARESGAEFSEVYAESTVNTAFELEESRLKSSSYSVRQGVGVRAIRGGQTGYAYADGFALDELREAARVAGRIARDGAAPGRPGPAS